MDRTDLTQRLQLAFECPMKWSEMKGDERKRFCGACQLHVYNVAEMTTPEIEALLGSDGRVCVNLYRRRDGTVITGDCSRVWRDRRDRALIELHQVAAIGAALVALAVIVLATVVLFGDNVRRLFGSTAGGLPATPAARSSPVTRSAPGATTPSSIKTFGESHTY